MAQVTADRGLVFPGRVLVTHPITEIPKHEGRHAKALAGGLSEAHAPCSQ